MNMCSTSVSQRCTLAASDAFLLAKEAINQTCDKSGVFRKGFFNHRFAEVRRKFELPTDRQHIRSYPSAGTTLGKGVNAAGGSEADSSIDSFLGGGDLFGGLIMGS